MDNNHLLLLMIHVFRENEEQLFKVKTEREFFLLSLRDGGFSVVAPAGFDIREVDTGYVSHFTPTL